MIYSDGNVNRMEDVLDTLAKPVHEPVVALDDLCGVEPTPVHGRVVHGESTPELSPLNLAVRIGGDSRAARGSQ